MQSDHDDQDMSWVVLKFGGTSVAGPLQWRTITRLVRERCEEGHRVLVVCSALAGVTDRLFRLDHGDEADLGALLHRHASLADQLAIDMRDLLAEAEGRLRQALAAYAEHPTPRRRAGIVAEGEWLATRFGQRVLSAEGPVSWVDARDALAVMPDKEPDSPQAWLRARCAPGRDEELRRRWEAFDGVLITQGYLSRGEGGDPALLGRGGSDTSAALLGGRLGAERVEIWTDVGGLYSADPREQRRARLLPRVAYREALEMAAGGARVIHGRSIRAAAAENLPLLIRDLEHSERSGTLIDGAAAQTEGQIQAVIHQRGMVGLLLENLDTRQQVGFLAGVFRVVSEHGISVDLVATSETTTTLAINGAANDLDDQVLTALAKDLEQLCRVEVFSRCSCVNLVGRGARRALPGLAAAEEFFAQHPLLMASQSANDMSISLLVLADDAPALAALLHQELVERQPRVDARIAHGSELPA